MSEEEKIVLSNLENNIPYEYCSSCDSEDGLYHEYIDEDSWQYKVKLLLEKQDKKIKELNDKIEDDKMIIEGNWGCIDNLRKDYNLQKNIIKEVREKINSYTTRTEVLNYQISDLTKKELLEILDKGE